MRSVKAALVQMRVTEDKERNLRFAADAVRRAADAGAQVVCLPEMFVCPYERHAFLAAREARGGRIWSALAQMAAGSRVVLVGGSFPEAVEGRLYNTCFVFDAAGRQIARHRKVHLFDIDIAGGQRFRESDTFSPGADLTVFDTPLGRFGVVICFDIRFPELMQLMALYGAEAVFVPASFNMTTGPAHWQLLFRARALDAQLFLLGCSAARDARSRYVAYGHSLAVSPWGTVLAELGAQPEMLLTTLDLDEVMKTRAQIPVMGGARRTDLYELRWQRGENLKKPRG
ncbi:carbon-nitrogen hydrolase family protein [uncultured Selenomonas sp.]|uniref:carbon-nitrogen hydrolase family protein n=1 Tax=uncultured Selenomonas sp. TaxID=159275 RepID=UPI0025850E85|nr:carbon-nitrogen hydrolase family protein [uncultured Selenomonas sp.]